MECVGISYELIMKYVWSSYEMNTNLSEVHMNLLWIFNEIGMTHSAHIDMNFPWSTFSFHMKFI